MASTCSASASACPARSASKAVCAVASGAMPSPNRSGRIGHAGGRPMPRARSTGLRERVLAAHQAREGGQAAIAGRAAGSASGRSPAGSRRPARGVGAGRSRVPAAESLWAAQAPCRPGWSRNATTRRRGAGRARRPAGRARRPPPQPCGPVPGAQAARLGPKGKTPRAAERDREDVAARRASWRADDLAGIDPERLVLVDGTGIGTRRTTRAHARAARGRRAPGKVPWPWALGALGAADHPPSARSRSTAAWSRP